jgi:hypothetical protein
MASVEQARSQAGINRGRRHEFLVRVSNGEAGTGPSDVLWTVCQPGNEFLLPLAVRSWATAVPGWGVPAANRLVTALVELVSEGHGDQLAPRKGKSRSSAARQRVTFSWVVDARAQGRRVLAWLALVHPKEPPWDGWPHSPEPTAPIALPLLSVTLPTMRNTQGVGSDGGVQ